MDQNKPVGNVSSWAEMDQNKPVGNVSSWAERKSKWGSEYYEEIPPPTPAEIEERKKRSRDEWRRRNPHFSVIINDYCEVWTQPNLRHVTWNSDDRKIHPTHTIYTLCENPLLQKLVIKEAKKNSQKPLLGMVITIRHESVTKESLIVDTFRPLNNSIELLIETDGILNSSQKKQQSQTEEDQLREQLHKSLGHLAITMAIGERCIMRRQLPTSTKGSNIFGKDYELELVELMSIWRRQIIYHCLVIDVPAGFNSGFIDSTDHTFKIHYELYKRSKQQDIEFIPQNGWMLIKDTRKDGVPDVIVCQNGRDLPCLERALLHLNLPGISGRLMSGPFFAAGPRIASQELPNIFTEFDRFDISKYSEYELENHDLLFLNLEILEVEPPDYLKFEDSVDGNLRAAESLKQRGNSFLGRNEYYRALKRYDKALTKLLDNGKFDSHTRIEYRVTIKAILLNASLVHMRLENFASAWALVQLVLNVDPENIKALYRGATCQRQLENYESAARMIDLAAHLRPNDRNIKAEKAEVNKALKEEEQRSAKGLKGLKETVGNWGIAESQIVQLDKTEKLEMQRKETETKLRGRSDIGLIVRDMLGDI